MSKQTDLLELKIKQLEGQLHDARTHTYIGETHSLVCANGELHIYYGNYPDDERCLVIDAEQLFKDLPFIVSEVAKEQNKMQEMYLNQLKDSLKEL